MTMSQRKAWRGLWVVAMFCLVCLVGVGQAETTEEAQKEKGKGKKSQIVEVDLKALPKDLAKELKKWLKDNPPETRTTEEPKDKKDKKGKKGKGEDKKGKGGEAKGKGKKGEDHGRTADLERQLERIAREIEDLRRELRKR
jgi:hypothetical protein